MNHDFILLDRSGSMDTLWTEALGSINSYVKKLAEDKVDTGVTLVAFDDAAIDVLRERILPSTWHDVTSKDAHPRGMTPLNDATANIVARAEAGGYDKVCIIIMTDGNENASKEYGVNSGGTAKIKALLDRCRAKGWQIIFLGANFDNQAQAFSYGGTRGTTISSSARNLGATMSATASMRTSYGATGQSMIYSEEMKTAAASDKDADDVLTKAKKTEI